MNNKNEYTMSINDITLLFGEQTTKNKKQIETIIISFVNSCVNKQILIFKDKTKIDKDKTEALEEIHEKIKEKFSSDKEIVKPIDLNLDILEKIKLKDY